MAKYYVTKNHKSGKDDKGQSRMVMAGTLVEMDEKEAAPFLKDGILRSQADVVKEKMEVVSNRKEGHLKQAKACDEELAALKAQLGSDAKSEQKKKDN